MVLLTLLLLRSMLPFLKLILHAELDFSEELQNDAEIISTPPNTEIILFIALSLAIQNPNSPAAGKYHCTAFIPSL